MFWIYLSSNENLPSAFLLLMLSEYLRSFRLTFFTLEIIYSWYESPRPSCLDSVDYKELNVLRVPKEIGVCCDAVVSQIINRGSSLGLLRLVLTTVLLNRTF